VRKALPRLTDGQRAVASDPANVALARRFAAGYARRSPWLADEIDSAALYALCRAAVTHDPARGAFEVCLFVRVHREVREALRMQAPRGFRRARPGDEVPWPVSLSVLNGGEAGIRYGQFHQYGEDGIGVPTGELPVGWEAESADEVRAALAGLPAKYGAAFRLHYLHAAGLRQKAAAAALGCHETNVHYMLKRGAAMLREQLGKGGDR
jgi:DNA-directed RNA polymerase specialized sigma24 family protein